jgi:putative heme-binding domain-containing protein
MTRWFLFAMLAAAVAAQDDLASAPAADLERGKKLFAGLCSACHGTEGAGGGAGPVLAKPKLVRARDDQGLMQVIRRGIPGTDMPAARQWDGREVYQLAAYVKKLGSVPEEKIPGDAAAGKTIYLGKGGCKSCHTIQGEGGRLGPELGDIGASRGARHLRQSLVEPEADFAERFMMVRFSAQGRTYEGVRLNEDTFSIQMMDAGERIHSFWKREITGLEELKGKSPMPSYKSSLTAAEMDDLVAYLVSLRGEE